MYMYACQHGVCIDVRIDRKEMVNDSRLLALHDDVQEATGRK
jgi:hypothetical protein